MTALADPIDLALEKNEDGVYDFVIENGELKLVNSFDTAIVMSVLIESRADESEVPVNFLRRGWWGTLFPRITGFVLGSKFWLLFQARATEDTKNKGVSFLQDGLQWFIDQGLLQNVIVTGEVFPDKSNITFLIQLVRFNNTVDSMAFNLWENTGE